VNIEIHDAALEARIHKQLQMTGSASVEEVLLRLLETQEEQDRWLLENRETANAKIRSGINQLDRGEEIPAVDCLGRWILEFGWTTYPGMKGILLLCDSGGSNGYRPRVWKYGNTASPNHYPSPRPYHYPVPLSPWCQQVESCRASPVQFHQPGVGRPPAPISTADDELHRGKGN
jgi:Rhodopirellula transposase DDE domain